MKQNKAHSTARQEKREKSSSKMYSHNARYSYASINTTDVGTSDRKKGALDFIYTGNKKGIEKNKIKKTKNRACAISGPNRKWSGDRHRFHRFIAPKIWGA